MRLIGPALGDRIEAFVQQGSESGNVAISGYDRNADISVEIQRQPVSHTPERVGVRVVGWSGFATPEGIHPGHDQRLTNIRYIVDFGDPGSVYSAPENLLPEWMDRNVGYGPMTAHVYRAPGTYTIRVWAYEVDSDRRAYFEQDVTIADVEEAFDGDTVFVTNSGAAAPAGAIATYSDFASAWAARSGNARSRVLFHAGDVFADHPYTVLVTPAGGAVVVDTDDPQGLVTLQLDPANFNGFRVRGVTGSNSQLVFARIRVEGGWDDVTETGQAEQIAWGDFSGNYQNQLTLDQCEALNCKAGVQNSGTDVDKDHRVTIHDCKIIGFRDVGVFSGAVPAVDILGTRIMRNLGSTAGGPKSGPPYYNNHGPIRFNAAHENEVCIDGLDAFSSAGWFVNHPNYSSQQPCIRGNQEGAFGSLSNIQRCSVEGGFYLFDFSRQNSFEPSAIQTILIEKINALASHQTNYLLFTDNGGITFRDVIFNIPNTPSIGNPFGVKGVVNAALPTTQPTALDVPVVLDGVTVNNQVTDANHPTGDAEIEWFVAGGGAVLTDLTIAPNCVMNQPSAASYAAPADYSGLTTDPMMTPRQQGYFDNAYGNTTVQTQYATPPGAAHKAAFPIGDALVNTVTADPGATDITGRKRGRMTPVGAWNPVRTA